MATHQDFKVAVFCAFLNVVAFLLHADPLYQLIVGTIFVGWTSGVYCYLTLDAPNPHPDMDSAGEPRDTLEKWIFVNTSYLIIALSIGYATSTLDKLLWIIAFLWLLIMGIESLFIIDKLRVKVTKLLGKAIDSLHDRVCLALRCLYRGVCQKYASWARTT
jgi:hypothetical protein